MMETNQKTDAERAEGWYANARPGGSDAAPESRLDAIVAGDLIDGERMAALAVNDSQLADGLDVARKEIVGVFSDLGLSQGAARQFIARVKERHLYPPRDGADSESMRFDSEEKLRVEHQWQADTGAKLSAARGLLSEIKSRAPHFSAFFNEGTEHDVELLKLLADVAAYRGRGRR